MSDKTRNTVVAKELKPLLSTMIADLLNQQNSGGGASDPYAIILYDTSGQKKLVYSVSDTGLTAALANAATGDVVWLPACSISGDHVVPAGVGLVGVGRDESILTGKLTTSSGSFVFGVHVNVSGTGDQYAIVGPDSGTATLVNVKATAASSSGDAIALALGDGAVNAHYCEFTGIGTGTGSGYGVAMGEGATSGTFNSWELPTTGSASASAQYQSNITLPITQQGDTSNYAWIAGGSTQPGRLTYDFGAAYNLTQIVVYAKGTGRTYIEASADGSSWDLFYSANPDGEQWTERTFNFSATDYRYLRFREEIFVLVGDEWYVAWFKLTGSVSGIGSGTGNLYWCKISGTTDDIKSTGGTVNVYACQYDVTNTTGTIVSLAGDRAARDAAVHPTLHTNDTDTATTSIHHTLGTGANQAAAGDHAHTGVYAAYVLNKLDATTAPTANDDSGDGYAVNSVWIDLTADKAYICVDATLTAAVWVEVGGGGTLADHDHSGDAGDGGTFDAANLTSGAATDGYVLTADGLGGAAWEAASGGAALTVEESDGTPSVANVTKIKVTNGTLTDDTGGTVTLDFGSAATDGAAIHDNTASEISAITEKTTPVSADMLIIEDSEAGNVKKMVQIGNLPGGSASGYYGTQLLRTVVAAGGQASFDLSSIPSGYDIIKIFIQGKTELASSGIDNVLIALNNDSTDTNYYFTQVQGVDTTGSASESDGRIVGSLGTVQGTEYVGQFEVTIIYPDSPFHKTITSTLMTRRTATQQYVGVRSISWENTAAINRITLTTISGSDFTEGTLCVIVGYKNFA